jgi:hypothetical protein
VNIDIQDDTFHPGMSCCAFLEVEHHDQLIEVVLNSTELFIYTERYQIDGKGFKPVKTDVLPSFMIKFLEDMTELQEELDAIPFELEDEDDQEHAAEFCYQMRQLVEELAQAPEFGALLETLI